MTAKSTNFKIGLLAIAAIIGLIVVAFALGISAVKQPTIAYHTFFDESVQGLDVGSPVKFRGVTAGHVSRIAIAPDRKSIAVTLALHAANAKGLEVPPGMRARLSTQGITGVKFVDLDFVDPKSPKPHLTFKPPANYIPSRPSLLKGLQDNLEEVGPKAVELVNRASLALGKIQGFMDELRERGVVERVASTVESFERTAQRLDHAHLGDKAATTLESLNATIAKVGNVVARFDGDAGLVADVRRALDSVADFGESAMAGTGELEQSMRDLGEAARAVRDLAEAIEREPDMLIKGRARGTKR